MLGLTKLTGPRRWILPLVALALMLSVTAVAYGAVREVGATADFSTIPCKDNNCRIVTRVTAIQTKVGPTKNISRVPRDGQVIAYTLSLPTVTKKFVANFKENYSGDPTARLSILRYAPRKGVTKHRYKLIAQSPVVKLNSYLGSKPSFALDVPLPVKKGDLIGITTDTWLPAFSVQAKDAASSWIASRPKGKCGVIGKDDYTNFKTARMHEKIGAIKQYRCPYNGARILYHATVVDTPKKTKGYK